MFVSSLQVSGYANVPPKFIESLPETCPYCDYPIEMSETFTGLHCSNPKCPSKSVQRLVSICTALGIKDFGEARISAFIEKFDYPSPLFIFAYDPSVHGELGEGISMAVSKSIYDQVQAKKRFTLAEFVKIAQLPNVQNSAVTIFGGFDDLQKAYEPIENEGVPYIAKKLGIEVSDDKVSVRALQVMTSLVTFRSELEDAIPYVEIIKTQSDDIIELTAVCSDQVGEPFKTKADFYAKVNNISPRLHVTFLSAVNRNIDYLVWAGANGTPARYTNKVQKVEAYNKQYEAKVANGTASPLDKKIPIVTGMDFILLCNNLLRGN